jgi:hypothetical protein
LYGVYLNYDYKEDSKYFYQSYNSKLRTGIIIFVIGGVFLVTFIISIVSFVKNSENTTSLNQNPENSSNYKTIQNDVQETPNNFYSHSLNQKEMPIYEEDPNQYNLPPPYNPQYQGNYDQQPLLRKDY